MKRTRQSTDTTTNDCICSYCKSHRVALTSGTSSAGSCSRRDQTSRRNSCLKIYTGDEHWTKVHQAKDVTASSSSSRPPWTGHRDDQQLADDQWVLSSSNYKRKCTTTKPPSVGFFHTLFLKLRDMVSSPRSDETRHAHFKCHSIDGAIEADFRRQGSDDAGVTHRKPLQSIVPPCCDVISTDDNCQVDSSSSFTMAAVSFPLSLSCGHVHTALDRTLVNHQPPTTNQLFYATWPLWSSKCCPRATRSGRNDTFLLKPTDRKAVNHQRHQNADQSVHSENLDERLLETLNADWSIPYGDVVIGQCIQDGSRRQVYRGRWHGDVLVHVYRQHTSEADERDFLKDVAKLSRIRHENVCLFMGACLKPSNFAIITSEVKGASLYEKLHVKSETSVSLRSRVNIARQVALAVGYLHARGVVVNKLDSRNVHLEPKVKISLLDHGMTSRSTSCRPGYGYLPRGKLTYIAPEMLRTMKLAPGCQLEFTSLAKPETDVFAFGTLLYELLYEQFPFNQTSPETIVYLVCTGRHPALNYVNCSPTLKVLTEHCWSFQPKDRPTFADINKELQLKTGLHKRHSSSHPDRLNRLGSTSKR